MIRINFFLFFLISGFFYAQKKAAAKIDYDITFALNGVENFKGSLLYNNEESLFNYKSTKTKDEQLISDNGNVHVNKADTLTKKIYNNRKENILFERTSLFTSKSIAIIKEEIPVFNWELVEGSKKINNFECHKATTTFRGRKYTAWYTLDIQSFFGPWKFNGLPGLILEIYDETKEVMMQVVKIEIPTIEKIIFNSNENKQVLYSEQKKLIEIEKQNVEKRIKAMQDRGFEIKIEMKQGKTIEME